MEKLFAGWRDEKGTVHVHEVAGKRSVPLPPRNDIWNHSPTGFEWGYGGSGPAQLALAILARVSDSDAIAIKWHQEFKCEVIAKLTHPSWQIRVTEVLAWVFAKVEELVDPAEFRLGREAFYDA